MALRLREFGHKSLALRSVVSGSIGGAAAIAAALAGWGLWSLVIQRFVTEVVSTITSWHAHKWVPGRGFSFAQLRTIAGFGANLTVTQIIFVLLVRVQDVIVGAMISAAAVGTYRTAWRTTELIAVGAIQPFTTVALQTLSRLQGDREGMVKAYRWMLSTSAVISFPALVGFGVVAPDAVPAIYGAQWVEAGHLAQAFAFMVVPLHPQLLRFAGSERLGHGREPADACDRATGPDGGSDHARRAVRYFRRGLRICRTRVPDAPVADLVLEAKWGITARITLRAIAAPFFASAIMGLAVWCIMAAVRPHISVALAAVLVGVAAGIVIYSVALLALSRQIRGVVRRQFVTRILKRPAK